MIQLVSTSLGQAQADGRKKFRAQPAQPANKRIYADQNPQKPAKPFANFAGSGAACGFATM
jgi:hypothetical protein